MSMPNNNRDNSASSQTAPPGGAPAATTVTPATPAPTGDESAYLARQAADARAAISATLARIGADLGQTASVAAWARHYPLITVGASAAAAFVATAVLVPSKEQQALSRLAKIERALHPSPPRKREDDATDGDDAGKFKTGRQSFARSILGEVIKAVQPALLSLLTASVTAHAAKPSQEDMQAAAAAEDPGQPPGA